MILPNLFQHKDNHLIWLQYCILNKILGTKSLLFNMSKSGDNLCRICKGAPETILHLFIQCDYSHTLWTYLQALGWFTRITNLTFDIDAQKILLGDTSENHYTLNILFLSTKYYIFQSLVRMKEPYLIMLQQFIKKVYEEQEYLSVIVLKQQFFTSGLSTRRDVNSSSMLQSILNI